MTTLKISTWGRNGLGTIAVRDGGDEYGHATEAVTRSIARRTGLSVVTCRADGMSVSGGKVESQHYQCTLGRAIYRRFRDGSRRHEGYSVEGEIWFAVPVAP